MGFDRAGFECAWQVEWDKNCQQTLAYHWPGVPLHSDVQEVVASELKPVDVVIFGSPCQDLSVAGKRAGLDGARSGMFYEAVRIIKEMQDGTDGAFPRIAVWENVVGALTSNEGGDFEVILQEMAELGAVVLEWAVLDARWFGVPQRRRRVFLVAIFDPRAADICPNPLLPVAPRSGWNPPARRAPWQGVADSVEGGPVGYVKAKRAMSNVDDDRWELTETAPTLNAFDNASESRSTVVVPVTVFQPGGMVRLGGHVWEEEVPTLRAESHQGDNTAHILQPLIFENSYRDGPRVGDDVCHTLPAKMGTGGGNTPMIAYEKKPLLSFDTQFGSNANVFEDESPTLKASQASPSVLIPNDTATNFDEYNFTGGEDTHHSIRAGTRQSTGVIVASNEELSLAHTIVRRLLPVETERLMGWPDNHTLHRADGKTNADTTRYKMCGNGVATPVAHWIATKIKPLLEEAS